MISSRPAAYCQWPELMLPFASAMALYWFTLAPTVIWGDSASLALQASRGTLHLGTAGDHPLFVLVGHWFAKLPGELAWNINLEAAVFGALAVMLVYRCARRLGCSPLAAGVGAAALAVSHAFWLHSVIAEVYTANAFFLSAILNLLIEWRYRRHGTWLAAAAIVFLIGLTNHVVLATIAPAALVCVLATKRRDLMTRRSFLALAVTAAVLMAFIGALPALVSAAFHKLWYGPPGIGEYFALAFDPRATAQEAAYYLLYFVYEFPSLSLPLGAIGTWILLRRQPAVAGLLLCTMGLNASVFIRHSVWPSASNPKYVFYIADYVVFSLLCAVGADEIIRRLGDRPPFRSRAWAFCILALVAVPPPAIYAIMPAVVRAAGIDLLHARKLPYRNNDRFFLNPSKRGETGARRFGEDALNAVKPGAVIFADDTLYAVLTYLNAHERRRPDVLLNGPPFGSAVRAHWVSENGHRRPTYLAALTPDYYDLSGLTGEYDLMPRGPIVEVSPR